LRILILSNNYQPELTGPAGYITDLAEYLVENGDEVTVITSFPHYPHWKVYPGFQQSLYPKSVDKGVKIIRCPIYVPSEPKTIKRIGYDLSYTVSSLIGGLMVKSFDLVYCVSPPLTIGLTAEILAKIKRCPFIFHIMDLIPETAAALGMLNNRSVINTLYRLEKYIYRHSDGIAAITQGFKNNILRRGLVDAEKIALLPIWVDTELIRPDFPAGDFREKLGFLREDVVFVYAGNIGNKQGLETLIDTAALLDNPETENIKFMVSGAGAQLEKLSRQAKLLHLRNVVFLPPQPEEDFYRLLAAADAFLLTQKNSVVEICLPSKLITYCAAGKPVIAAVHPDSDTAHFIQASGGGVVCEPENTGILRSEILQLAKNQTYRSELGGNGRKYIELNYNRKKILADYRQYIHEIIRVSK